MYVLEGPEKIGNPLGFYGRDVAEGLFAVVRDGEYANGGHGPISVDGILYRSRERAEKALEKLQAGG